MRFPEPLEVGMQFEGVPEPSGEEDVEGANLAADTEDDEDSLIYTVTDVADHQVVLDGNHPLAGMALRFWVQVENIREATSDEIENGHPEGAEGLTFGMPNDEDDSENDDLDSLLDGGMLNNPNPRTLH